MKYTGPFFLFLFIVMGCASSENQESLTALRGDSLYQSVEKYVSFGEHRTATPTDYATSEWLRHELTGSGYDVKFTEFSLKQFFLEEALVAHQGTGSSYNAFPSWYLNDSIPLQVEGILTTGEVTNLKEVRNKIVLLNFAFGEQGQSAGHIRKKLIELSEAGALAVIGYQENKSGEIAAFNAPQNGSSWPIPIVSVNAADAVQLKAKVNEKINISIKGKFESVLAKNVYGTIGKEDQYIVISTPISGWFTCGGERGPGVAIWLGLAKWAAAQELPYTFVFTGNTGHELGFWGADEFLEHDAPPIDKTKLWIHLGAGAATLSWKQTESGLVKEHKVDSARNFFYTTSVKESFDKAFQQVPGNKWDTNEKNGGELLHVVKKGYPHALGISYAHPFFHTKQDDATQTSPEILEETANAFKNFIEEVTRK